MTHDEVTKIAKELTAEQRKEVVKMLAEASGLINSVECKLQGLSIVHPDLILNGTPTLWTNLYRLRKLFDFENHE